MTRLLVADVSLVDYQYKMCLHGALPYLMPYEIITLPRGYEYVYNALLYRPLWQNDTSLMTVLELKAFLSAFAGMIQSLHEHLLDLQKVSMDEDAIKTDGDGNIVFMYKPFQNQEQYSQRQMIESWLMVLHRHVDMACEYTMGILHPVNIAAASENMDLTDFGKLIQKTIGDHQ